MAAFDTPHPLLSDPKITPFDISELQELIGNKLDRASLASACAVSKSWHAAYMPILWDSVHFTHDFRDDHYDDEHNIVSPPARWGYTSSVSSSLSSSPTSSYSSPPSSLSSTPSLSTTFRASVSPLSSSPGSLITGDASLHGYQQLGVHADGSRRRRSSRASHSKIVIPFSQNRVLRGLVRNGQWISHLVATGITDQEMELIGRQCTNLRILELHGGRYSAESATEMFQQLDQSLRVIRFQSCIPLQDIFKPLMHLTNIQDFELHGSFIANTIASLKFFERDLFPMLGACPSLSTMVIKDVYIVDQQSDQAGCQVPASYLKHTPIHETLSPGSMVARPEFLDFLRGTANRVTYPSLKHLTLECSDIPDAVILELLIRCPNIERLALFHSRELSDTTLFLLQYTCPRLRSLSLTQAENVTMAGFISLLSAFSGLAELDLSCNMLSDEVLGRLSLLTELAVLNLEQCEGVTDAGIRSVLQQCKRLQTFNFRHITGLSNRIWGDFVPTSADGSRVVCLPLADQAWSCQATLESLHVPELSNFGQRQSLTPIVMASLPPAYQMTAERFLDDNELIRCRLASLERLSNLVIGGHMLHLRTILRDRKNPHLLERLSLTRLDRKMTLEDTAWLIEEAAPNLQQLRIPALGSFEVSLWANRMRPGLVR
ncbi:hypothetical protein DFQ26_002975 [Actinomortierella ambigua]|nr:hypothetical protein DFQ26_002975 [Actinomortierella ambigua]